MLHFWEDICEFLNTLGIFEATRIVHGSLVGTSVELLAVRASISTAAPTDPVPFLGDSYSEIEQLIADRRLETAQYHVDKLPIGSEFEKLPQSEQYSILRLRAKITFEHGRFEEAGRLFVLAFETFPDSAQAKQNHVLGLWLLGDSESAYSVGSGYINEGLVTAPLLVNLIQSAKSPQQIAPFQEQIEEHARTDESINTALAHKYLSWGEMQNAARAAERALELSPNSPHARFFVAAVAHNSALAGDWKRRKANIDTAIGHYDAAESDARKQQYARLIPEILTNRGAAKVLGEDFDGARIDYLNAVKSADEPELYAIAAAMFFLQTGDFEASKSLHQYMTSHSLNSRFVIALTSHELDENNSEVIAAEREMASLAEQDWDKAVDCRFFCVQWALSNEDVASARSFVTREFQEAHAFQGHLLSAWIETKANNQEAAETAIGLALQEYPNNPRSQELRLLASILKNLGNYDHAIAVLEQVVVPGLLNEDMEALLECASTAQRHDLLIRICDELRQTGQIDERGRRLHIQLLGNYSPERGIELAEEYMTTSGDFRYFNAWRNFLLTQLKRQNEADVELSRLPKCGDLSLEETYLVTNPLLTLEINV